MADKSAAITLLRLCSVLLPGVWLKTSWYLNFVAKPRRVLRTMLHGFYRMEHIYDVLREVRARYRGRFSILEFGTNEGYALEKMLYATKYLGMADRVTVHGFDTFEGMPKPQDRRDIDIVAEREVWVEGQFQGGCEKLQRHLSRKYTNFTLHKGLFEETMKPDRMARFREELPVLVWIDCDFYSSARAAVERVLPYLPNGCVVYFDEYELNYGSRFTGEARIVYEVNRGVFGPGLELVLDRQLSLDSQRIYRFLRFEDAIHYELAAEPDPDPGRAPTNGSPLP